MLRKFLQNLSKLKSQENNPNPQNNGVNFFTQSSSPNLLNVEEIYTSSDKYAVKLSNVSTLIVIVVSSIFGMMLLYNAELDRRLNKAKVLQDELTVHLGSLNDTMLLAREISDKISKYKEVSAKKTNLTPKMHAAYESVGENSEIWAFSTVPEKFVIVVKSPDLLFFSRLIYTYLNTGYVSEIHLRSAVFNLSDNLFSVEMEGIYK